MSRTPRSSRTRAPQNPQTASPVAAAMAAVGLAALLGAVGYAAFKISQLEEVPRHQDVLAVVLDTSPTVVRTELCESLDAVAMDHFRDAEEDAAVVIWATAEARTGNVEHVATLTMVQQVVSVEIADHGARDGQLEDLATQVNKHCNDGLADTNESPIREAIVETAHTLDARWDCDQPWSECRIVYIGDGLDDRDPAMKALLKDRPADIQPQSTLDIPVELCGISDRQVGKWDAIPLPRVRSTWQAALTPEPTVLAECAS